MSICGDTAWFPTIFIYVRLRIPVVNKWIYTYLLTCVCVYNKQKHFIEVWKYKISEIINIMSTSPNPLDKYGDDDIFSTVLRWSLYFGAFFQLACIMASIFMSTQDKNDCDTLEDSKTSGVEAQPNNRRLHKLRKQEKKKRR